MNGIVCGTCGYVALDGKAPENCPVCNTPKSGFSETENAINQPADKENLTELEQKHIPVVEVVKSCGLVPEGCQDALVRVGKILHPAEAEHVIVWIDLYNDNEWISRVHLSSNVNPAIINHLKSGDTGKLSVVAFCNQHGKWIKEIDF
ncbi:MAG: desulfoferrodoxin family protein [Candidatus Woesearchaeota archaeon]